ncbi:hypothetical protein PRECH8_22990 [Insulibacter thermoxylanivorax]|uniref:Uncharacterized protein n=1 Tax=Insulibacter thermoxylanivorax TaxID=2749268 RepID=A0A916QHC8_9BACL|nr:hypothetical protein [Insulibacter thermoxylanivorax]GFR39003.1 hypothetical protein PRECH8_22990 [Insulibacter thermoxylanivorax]
MNVKFVSFIIMRLLSLGIGIVFPFVSIVWKTTILILFFIFRVIDIERDRKLFGVTSMFFLGMILAYLYRLIWN